MTVKSDVIVTQEAFKWVRRANKEAERKVLKHFLIDEFDNRKVLLASDACRIHLVFEDLVKWFCDLATFETGIYKVDKVEEELGDGKKRRVDVFLKVEDEDLQYPDWKAVVPLGKSEWWEKVWSKKVGVVTNVQEMSGVMCRIYQACLGRSFCFNYKFLEDVLCLGMQKIRGGFLTDIEVTVWGNDGSMGSVEVKYMEWDKVVAYGYVMGLRVE